MQKYAAGVYNNNLNQKKIESFAKRPFLTDFCAPDERDLSTGSLNIWIFPWTSNSISLIKRERSTYQYQGEKCAIVAPTDVGFGIARIHSALIDGENVDAAVFRDVGEALAWLEIELDDELIPS